MEDYPVWLPSAIMADCYLDRWNALSPAQRNDIAVAIRDSLAEHRYGFEYWWIEEHGPDSEQPVLVLTDTRTLLDFALIPGGTLLPGYDDAQLEGFAEVFDLVEGWKKEAYPDVEEETPERMSFFGSKAPCDLRRKPPVSIAPFLIAVMPLMASTPGIQQVVTLPEWWRQTWEEMSQRREPVRLRWEMVPPVLRHYGWKVPTTWEYEWSVKGGMEGIFYWGENVPRFVADPYPYHEPDGEMRVFTQQQLRLITDDVHFDSVMISRFSRSRPREWPYCNRFGIVGPVAQGHWCVPSKEANDPCPLIVRGGARAGWPWQSCREWMLLLSAAESRLAYDTDYCDWNVLRPVIRLCSYE